jgi:hypothetical protein
VGLVVTLLLGLGGIAGTLIAGFRQTDTAIRVAKLSIDGQLAGAREERQQRRLEAAYTELLIRLTVVRNWANAVYPRAMIRTCGWPRPGDVKGRTFPRKI